MSKFTVLKKTDFNEFILKLANKGKVVAPVHKGEKSFAFEEVKSGNEISLHYIPTILPPKKYFMPQTEKILEYNKKECSWSPVLEYEKVTIFGVHTCDLAGIQCLNMALTLKPKDVNYIIRKNKITIIGFECNQYCDEFASCAVMDNHLPNGGYDLFFTELKDHFIVDVNTPEGEEIVETTTLFSEATPAHENELELIREEKRKIFKDEVKVKHQKLKPLFERSFDSPVWDDLDKRCVSCGNCTNVCPTCYCFDLTDEMNLDMNTGTRYRVWDSCQNEEFAKIASGENFRKKRGERQRHRYMRKFNYPVERFSRYFCTGCGRCSRACMAKINLKETINQIADADK